MTPRTVSGIAWFVSDHGWGHAARQRELMLAFREACPGARICVVSGVPKWFWNPVRHMKFVNWTSGPSPRESPGRIDREATRMMLMGFPERIEDLMKECCGMIASEAPSLVVTDIDPIPSAAAYQSGVDALAVANFTWDWIYREMFPDQGGICDTIGDLYRTAHFLRLPLGPPHSPFYTSEEVGLVPGGSPRSTFRARELLGHRPVLLVMLRDTRRLGVATLEVPRGWHAVCSLPYPGLEGVENITPIELEAHGLMFADLAAASDALLMTPGYGAVSLALSLGKPVIAVDRDDFPEVPYLVRPLEERPATLICAPEAIRGDGLAEALEAITQVPAPPPLACDTDFVVSQILERAAQGHDAHRMPGRRIAGRSE